jgi:hypothetical protein
LAVLKLVRKGMVDDAISGQRECYLIMNSKTKNGLFGRKRKIFVIKIDLAFP